MGKKTLEEWKEMIAREVPFIGIKEYSHNIVGLALAAVANEYGKKVANDLIDEFNLEDSGWRKVPEQLDEEE